MAQYINKDAVMAIIKNHLSMIVGIPGHFNESSLCNEILIDIDTLEVKEVKEKTEAREEDNGAEGS